jgi:hypothetical protein
MKRFLAIYTGTPASMSRWNDLSESERQVRQQAGISAWHAWGEKHKDAILDAGGPLGRTKGVTSAGIADVRNAMTGYTVIRAESHEAAAQLFENHPHFTIFPGDGVDVMECLPIPGLDG